MPSHLSPTRRAVLAGIGAATAAAAVLPAAGVAAAEAPMTDGFVWGVAASAPQTESADGRGNSVWDVFARRPGSIRDGSDLCVTTAFDRLYATDIGLIADTGLQALRFSFAWPRIQPEGRGRPDAAGLDLYDRILDAMLARGLTPWATTLHWDVPAALGDRRSRDVAFRYADYAAILAGRFGDRIHQWIVLNEPNVVALFGYGYGDHAPGLRDRDAVLAAIHHQNLAQGLGFQALRASLPAGRHIGTTLSLQPARPADGAAANADAAQALDALWNGAFLQALFGRPYPEPLQAALEPWMQPGDERIVAAAPNFLGVNYYSPLYATADPGHPMGMRVSPRRRPGYAHRHRLASRAGRAHPDAAAAEAGLRRSADGRHRVRCRLRRSAAAGRYDRRSAAGYISSAATCWRCAPPSPVQAG
ncbi:MAG: family 1 glycosylhydrolase [Rhodospirillales bacterium]